MTAPQGSRHNAEPDAVPGAVLPGAGGFAELSSSRCSSSRAEALRGRGRWTLPGFDHEFLPEWSIPIGGKDIGALQR